MDFSSAHQCRLARTGVPHPSGSCTLWGPVPFFPHVTIPFLGGSISFGAPGLDSLSSFEILPIRAHRVIFLRIQR